MDTILPPLHSEITSYLVHSLGLLMFPEIFGPTCKRASSVPPIVTSTE